MNAHIHLKKENNSLTWSNAKFDPVVKWEQIDICRQTLKKKKLGLRPDLT